MGDLLLALQKERGTLINRVFNIEVGLKNTSGAKTLYTGADLQEANKRLEEVDVAVAAIKLHRKCKPISEVQFEKIIKVKDLRAALSHADDQDKRLWAYDQQSACFEHVVGIKQDEYNGKPTINLQINVLGDGQN